jgi:hypothetical protein
MVARKSDIFDLSNYEKETDVQYRSYKIKVDADTTVVLRNPLLIPDENKERLFELVPQMQFEGEPTNDDVKRISPLILEVFELVGDKNVSALIERVRGNLPVLMSIFEDYFKTIQLGEATSSES